MSALIVVKPVVITDAMLISTDVPEADYAAWSGVTTYALADRAIVVATHKIYESVQAGNLNHAVTDTDWWIEVSPTNRWKCFDTSNSTQTAKATSAQYVLRPLQTISHVALLNNTDVTSMRVRLVSDAYGAVYDDTIYISNILPESSWYAWFIGAKTALSAAFLDDIPSYPDATITIDITGQTTQAFGVLLIGQAQNIGQSVQHGARVSIQDYSRKETNAFGDTVLVQRAFAKRASFSIRLSSAEVDSVYDYLAALRATPCLWIGSGLYTSTYVFGVYENFETTIQYFAFSDCSLNLLGLT